MDVKLNRFDDASGSAHRGWLAGWLLRDGQDLLPRWSFFYHRIAALPHNWRRQMRRKLAVTLSGAALLLALSGPISAPVAYAEADATITVVNGEIFNIANNKCSLSEAIINARATSAGQMKADCKAGNVSGADTISLPAGGLFDLTVAHNSQHGPTGLPVITADMTIEGNGATIRRSYTAGTEPFRILAIDPNVRFTLRNTTLRNGLVNGDYDGGAILSEGELVIENSVIADNTARDGGGVWALDADISGSRLVNNRATGNDYGGVGGGLWARQLAMNESTVAGNVADGSNDYGGWAGGIAMDNGTISNSTISGNLAGEGSDYFWPVPGLGGGVLVEVSASISNSTISGNVANRGGGVFLYGDADLVQSSISGNTVLTAVSEYDEYYNVPGRGGGIFVNKGQECAAATLRGLVVSGNTAEGDGPELWVDSSTSGCVPNVTNDGFNVFGHNGNAGTANFTPGLNDVVPAVSLAAILGPLADNGGPTQTHALVADSPALDVAPSNSCTAEPINGLDQRGEPRNADGGDGVSANECDAGSFELQAAASGGAFLVSAARAGTVGGVAFTPADILKYDPVAGWSLYFDASDVDVTKNLGAFDVEDDGDILMSFLTKQVIGGVGAFQPQDIARFTPTSIGSSTNGTFSWEFDGSANLLTTVGEKIDAIAEIGDGRIAISTTGTAAVKLPNGTVLKAQDEDALGFNPGNGRWSAYFDGTSIPGLNVEDVTAMWIDPITGDVYVSLASAFNLGGVKGNGKDIVKLTPSGAPGGYTPSLWWDGSAEGFPSTINGLALLP